MDPIIFILPIVGGFLLFYLTKIIIRLPGRSLNKKFVKLGNFSKLTKNEFIAAVGSPQAISNLNDGLQLLQWHATGYRMSILFDEKGAFIKIHSEINS
jgi:hypothetical protein